MSPSNALFAAFGLAAAAFAQPAYVVAQEGADPASPPSAAQPPEGVEEVVVRGQRMSEIDFDLSVYVQRFVTEVAAPALERGYARWQETVCVGVYLLQNDAAQYIIDRISLAVLDVGLEPGEPGCTPDVVIMFSTDAKMLAEYAIENQPALFRPYGSAEGMTLGLDALDEFARSDRAVRWWHVSLPTDARSGDAAVVVPNGQRMASDPAYPTIAVSGPSRLHGGIRDDLKRVVIVVDATKLTGTTWQQLADYLAVVSLAQIDPDTNPEAFDSILNLFNNPLAYSGLTDWDRAYLKALYSFDQERMPTMQMGDLVSRMVREDEEATAQP
jgi:hypothetical protein